MQYHWKGLHKKKISLRENVEMCIARWSFFIFLNLQNEGSGYDTGQNLKKLSSDFANFP